MTQSFGVKEAGIIQLPLSATQKGATSTKRASKATAPRLKLIVRRLPPGLTRAEFEGILGDDWKVGRGKVDWFQYKPGKISKDPAKPSRPARAYVHLVSEESIASLSEKVRASSFRDAKNTSNDPILLGPPSVEFAPYARAPGGRSRKDARQGTIDQDPEFVAFLESLTNPITKPAAPTDSEPEKPADEEVTITPLVQFLKEKKASKAKESASAKSNKRGGKEKDSKAEKLETKKLLRKSDREGATDSTPASPEKKSNSAKIEEATKEAVKAARKQISASLAKQATSKEGRQTPEVTASTSERRRERGDVRAAAMILQRDLGLAPSGGRRRGKAGAAASTTKENEPGNTKEVKAEIVTSTPATPTAPNAPKGNSKSNRETTSKATGPPNKAKASTPAPPAPSTPSTPSTIPDLNTTVPAVADGLPSTSTNKPSKAAKQAKPKPSPITSSTATQAFLKHANPSQGVTEELLDAAFNVFGKVLRVEIDKKKGFGYVDFAQAEGLQKAIAASPVTVAQSQVVVLERKNPPTQQGKAAAAKSTGEGVSQASSVASTQQPANASPGGGSQKRSRGPRSRGGRGKKGTGKTETGDVASEN